MSRQTSDRRSAPRSSSASLRLLSILVAAATLLAVVDSAAAQPPPLPRGASATFAAMAPVSLTASAAPTTTRPPNFVIIFMDDLGYGDVGCYGATDLSTPHLDRMAAEGRRFTSFYVAQAVCSASRTALLTGCYPNRLSILGALGPQSTNGIADEETTLAETLRSVGYRTAIFGKWHLGHWPQFLPTRHGFDEYFGLPYSNDMWPRHPTAKFPDLPLIEEDRVVARNPDQSQLTKWYTERAVQFIERHAAEPFFVYLPHAMPHVPLFASEKFAGRSPRGVFGDVIAEMDWSVGEILSTVRRLKLDEQTLVLFTSDNGPWLSYGDHAGSSGPFREGKGTAWDGGVRVPCIARWPSRVPAGTVSDQLWATIDVLPTLAGLAGASLPRAAIDGIDCRPVLFDPVTTVSPRQDYWFYWDRELQAVRQGSWKLHFPHTYRSLKGQPAGTNGRPGPYQLLRTERALYNLERDPGETRDVLTEQPAVVAALEALAERARQELGDSLTLRKGAHVRPSGQLVSQPPRP